MKLLLLPLLVLLQITLVKSQSLDTFFQARNILPKSTPEGIFYTIEKEGRGASPKKGNYLKIKYVGKLLDETVFDASSEGEFFVFRFGVRQIIEGWERGIAQLKAGSKATIYVPANKAYGTRGLGKVPPDAPLIFEVNFEKILTDAEYEKYTEDLEMKEKKAFEQQKKVQFEKDLAIIKDFAKAKNLNTIKTSSGLHYAITKKGKGEMPLKGDYVSVDYEGFLTDDTSFDKSKKEPYRFVLGTGKVIAGWDEGLAFFPKGAEGWLLIPSNLAYGALAIKDRNVPANAVLCFKVKMSEIKKNK
jgi:peptidylprolyl isomerase